MASNFRRPRRASLESQPIVSRCAREYGLSHGTIERVRHFACAQAYTANAVP